MILLQLLPVILSFVLIGAHFLRDGYLLMVAFSLAVPFVLLVGRTWAARAVQVLLIIAAGEWIRTTIGLVTARQEEGQDYLRLAVILGAVTLLTLGSTFVFHSHTLKHRYRLGCPTP